MDNQILAHTKYNCTDHIIFIPKYRRKVMYGKIGEILSTVCKITGVKLTKKVYRRAGSVQQNRRIKSLF